MIKSLTLGLAGAALFAAAATPSPAEARQKLSSEERLEKILEGRVAGEPSNCISLSSISSSQVIERTAIVYRAGRTIWVNRPAGGANALDGNTIMVTKPVGNQLCSIDTVQLVDNSSRAWRGFVQLGDFIPYRKAD